MINKDFQFSFESSKTVSEIYPILLDVRKWRSGIYNETIKGESKNLNDVFTFSAGDWAHQSTQKLVELVPNKKVEWLVTNSNLSFLQNPNEWDNTKICFDIEQKEDKTLVTFTHKWLNPEIKCYNSCSDAWTQYLRNLKEKLS